MEQEHQKKIKKNNLKDEYIYYSASINNIYVNNPKSINFFIEDYPGTLLEKMSDYQMSIVSFSIVAQLPIFILPIKEGNNNNKNLTNFGVCFTYDGAEYSSPCIYTADNDREKKTKSPAQNNGVQDNSAGYYNIYSFHNFIDMVNTALLDAFTKMQNDNEGLPVSSPPFFIYNADSGLTSLIAPYEYSYSNAPSLFINNLLYNYFDSLRIDFLGRGNPNYLDYKIIIKDYKNNWWNYGGQSIPNPPTFLQMEQEYDTRYLYANLRSIVFLTNIPTRLEYLPPVKNPNTLDTGLNNPNPFVPNTKQILTTFDIQFGGGVDWRQPIQFSANSLDRWIDLVSDDPLNFITISLYLQYTNGSLIPLAVPINQSCDIKLVFRKINK